MRKFRMPNTYVIIAAIIALCAVATWFVPGGQYVTGEDGTLSYEQVDAVPQTLQVFTAIYHGFVKQAGIIVFILVVGGAFWLLNATGAVSAGIGRFIGKIGKKDKIVLAALTVLFSLAGAVFGMSEETIPFIGIVVPLVVSMGYDPIMGMLVVGFASGIIVILQDGRIVDSLLHSMQEGLDGSSRPVSLAAMYGIQALINFVIPSASAKAAITIPIMAPFSDMVGVSRQAMVLAYQFGDGFTNMVTPTSGVLVAALAMARIPYTRWVRWIWKPVLAVLLIGLLLLIPTCLFPIPGF